MHYKQLDGLRFLAVVAVIFHHVFPFLGIIHIDLGFFGVNLFFVISGFLITEILLKQKHSNVKMGSILKTFFLRRSIRIFPLYFLYVFLCFLLVPDQLNDYLLWIITYSINFWIVLNNEWAFWYFTHLWSLSVEEQFYLIWPFLVILIPSFRFKSTLIFLILFAVVLRAIVFLTFDEFKLFNYTMLPATLDCFGIGGLLAFLKQKQTLVLMKLLKYKSFLVVGCVLYLTNSVFGNEFMHQVFNRFLTAVISFYLVGIASTTEFRSVFQKFLEFRLIAYIGKISYGMYIYHLMVWGTFGIYFNQFWAQFSTIQEPTMLKSFFEFVFVLLLTFLISTISFELFEKQILKLKKHVNYN